MFQMINILIPMAGAGSRFSQAGYIKPKPFIDVAGKPMIVRVLENLAMPEANYILIARADHLLKEAELVKEIEQNFNATFVTVDELTEGTACTVLFARHLFNSDTPLLIANSDQVVDFKVNDFIDDMVARELDGSILTFIDSERNPKWSFAKTGTDELVVEVKEKEAISDKATVGIYLFNRGREFIDSAIDMILAQDRVNGEYYTCPVYNYMVNKGLKIGIFNIEETAMHGIGTPEDLKAYLGLYSR